jgi:hypothetical protein
MYSTRFDPCQTLFPCITSSQVVFWSPLVTLDRDKKQRLAWWNGKSAQGWDKGLRNTISEIFGFFNCLKFVDI